ncbi:hypothetical protein E8E11_004369 [Didymella keratinophila]|nr:hypothetical protein E8E11_004369 [Didymella keratinophila]
MQTNKVATREKVRDDSKMDKEEHRPATSHLIKIVTQSKVWQPRSLDWQDQQRYHEDAKKNNHYWNAKSGEFSSPSIAEEKAEPPSQ